MERSSGIRDVMDSIKESRIARSAAAFMMVGYLAACQGALAEGDPDTCSRVYDAIPDFAEDSLEDNQTLQNCTPEGSAGLTVAQDQGADMKVVVPGNIVAENAPLADARPRIESMIENGVYDLDALIAANEHSLIPEELSLIHI